MQRELSLDELRNMDAGKCCDIILLTHCIVCHLYDLQRHLEESGTWRFPYSQAVNRALTLTNRMCLDYRFEYRQSATLGRNINELGDMFMEKIDSHIGMEGIEREMNIIQSCLDRIIRYRNEVMRAYRLFSPVPVIAKNCERVGRFLNVFEGQYERHDLEIIFNQQLKSLYSTRTYE